MPPLTDYEPEHQRKVQEYMQENRHRLPPSGNYTPAAFRSLDAYTHSPAHRKLVRLARMNGEDPATEAELIQAFQAELALTVGSRYELFSWTTYAEGLWVRDLMQAHVAAVRRGVMCSSQGNSPDDIIGELLATGEDDPLTLVGIA